MVGVFEADVHVVPVLELLQRHPQVQLAQARGHQLVGHRVHLRAEGGVLVVHAQQRLAELHLVVAVLHLQGQRDHRRRVARQPGRPAVEQLGRVQHLVDVNVLHLRERHHVAGPGRARQLRVLAALDLEHVRGLARLAVGPADEGRLGVEPALEDAQHRQLPQVRVVRHLEDVRQKRRVGVAGHLHQLVVLPHAPRAAGQRAGRLFHQHVQQVVQAHLRLRRHEQHRHHVALVHRLHEVLPQAGQGNLLAAQVPLQLRVVDLHHALQQLAVQLLHIAKVRLARLLVEAVDDVGALARRQVEAVQLGAERVAQVLDQARQALRVGVDLVDDHHARQARLTRRVEEPARVELHPRHRVDHQQRRLHRRQRRQRVAHEVRVPRGVDEVELLALAAGEQQRRIGGVPMPPGLRLEVGGGRGLLHGAQAGDGAAAKQQRLGERRLARAPMPQQHDVADVLRPETRNLAHGVSSVTRGGRTLRLRPCRWLAFDGEML